jgi:hypothetical protein
MAPADFELLVNLIRPKTANADVIYSAAAPDEEKLAVTLLGLAIGNTFSKFRNKQSARLYQKPTQPSLIFPKRRI